MTLLRSLLNWVIDLTQALVSGAIETALYFKLEWGIPPAMTCMLFFGQFMGACFLFYHWQLANRFERWGVTEDQLKRVFVAAFHPTYKMEGPFLQYDDTQCHLYATVGKVLQNGIPYRQMLLTFSGKFLVPPEWRNSIVTGKVEVFRLGEWAGLFLGRELVQTADVEESHQLEPEDVFLVSNSVTSVTLLFALDYTPAVQIQT